MIFKIRPGLEQSKVFDGLNRLLRELIMATLQGRGVDESQIPEGLYDAVKDNPPTFGALTKLLEKFSLLKRAERDSLHDALHENVEPYCFLESRDLPLIAIPTCIFSELKALAFHLYARTAKLIAVEAACGERIEDHYARFRADAPPGNGNICCVCGTEPLAQMQSGVDDADQWRGPYDHLLSKDDYPLYGVSPGNLVPICQTCNSKAKLAKDLLFKGGIRRLSFCPWTESVMREEVQVFIDHDPGLPRVAVKLFSADPDRQEKLDSWDEIYKISARVEGEFTSLFEKLAEDIRALSEPGFVAELRDCANARGIRSRLTAFNYWRARVYNAVAAMDRRDREALRLTILNERPQTAAMDDLFF